MERKKSQGLNPFERTIVDVVDRARRPLSVNQISEFGEMNWKTADKYVETLEKRGTLTCDRTSNRTICDIKKKK